MYPVVEKYVNFYLAKAQTVCPGLILPPLEVDVNLRGVKAGQFTCKRFRGGTMVDCRLRINRELLQFGEREVQETVGHEVAHFVANVLHQDNCCHDARWAAVMQRFDLPATRCHRLPLKKARLEQAYSYTCCGRDYHIGPRIYTALVLGNKRGTCKVCGARIDPLLCVPKYCALTTWRVNEHEREKG